MRIWKLSHTSPLCALSVIYHLGGLWPSFFSSLQLVCISSAGKRLLDLVITPNSLFQLHPYCHNSNTLVKIKGSEDVEVIKLGLLLTLTLLLEYPYKKWRGLSLKWEGKTEPILNWSFVTDDLFWIVSHLRMTFLEPIACCAWFVPSRFCVLSR